MKPNPRHATRLVQNFLRNQNFTRHNPRLVTKPTFFTTESKTVKEGKVLRPMVMMMVDQMKTSLQRIMMMVVMMVMVMMVVMMMIYI